MLNRDCDRIVARYLAAADRLLPGRITGFYIVGSAALGAWRAGCSDIDFVGVVEGDPTDRDVRRLRVLHALGNTIAIGRALLRAQPTFPGTMNGVFVLASDLSRPVTQIRPLASHSGPSFQRGRGFDANPVTWKVLAERGITIRGVAPTALDSTRNQVGSAPGTWTNSTATGAASPTRPCPGDHPASRWCHRTAR